MKDRPGERGPGRGGRVIAGAMLLDFAVSPLFAWGVLSPAVARDLAVEPSTLTVVFSTGLVGFTTGVLVGGVAADLVAAGWLALITGAGAVGGMLVTANAGSVPVVVLGFGVMMGTATGVGYVTAVRVAGTLTARRGLGLALVVSTYAAGTILIAPLTAVLLQTTGRRLTLTAEAVLLAGCLVGAAALLPWSPVRPARMPPPPSRRGEWPRWRVGSLWLAFGLGSAPALGAFAYAGNIVGDPGKVGLAVALLSAGNLGGRLVAGPLSDRFGPSVTLHGNAALLAAASLTLVLAHGPPVLAGLFLLGTQYGALSALIPAATASTVPPHQYGRSYGIVFTGWGLAGLVSPLAMAWLASRAGNQLIFAVATAVALLMWANVAALTARSTSPL